MKSKILIVIISSFLLISSCTSATPSPTPTPSPRPTFTLRPTRTLTPSPTPTLVPTLINIEESTHEIIREAYETYYEEKENISNSLGRRAWLFDMMPHKGIYWPFLVYEPKEIKSRNILVRIPNTGNFNFQDDNDYLTHINVAVEDINTRRWEADDIGAIYIVPMYPRFSIPHTFGPQYLSQFTLNTPYIELKDVDFQLIAIVDEIINIYASRGIELSRKVLLTGYSATSYFNSRFTALHPELVQAVSLGGCSWVTLPFQEYDGFKLSFPFGTYDLDDYGRSQPSIEDFQDVSIYYFLGSLDHYGGNGYWDVSAINDGYNNKDYQSPNKSFFNKFGITAEELFSTNREMLESISKGNIKFEFQVGWDHGESFQNSYVKAAKFLEMNAEYFDK